MKRELRASADQANIERAQSRDQARLDRQHDADQAHQERITKARREVYLELIGELTVAQTALLMLPKQDAENLDTQSGFNGLIIATSKISILGELPTVEMSRELLSLIHEVMFRAFARLVPLHALKIEVQDQDKKIAFQHSEIHRIADEIKTIEETSQDKGHLFLLRKALAHRGADANAIGGSAMEARNAYHEAQRAYAVAIQGETNAISRKLDELICAIRIELALPTSLEVLNATSDAMQAAREKALRGLYTDLGIVPR